MNRREARETLGLPPLYTVDDVEAAYRERARTTHPDRGGSNEHFLAITESRRILLAPPPRRGRLIAKDDRPLARLASRLRNLRRRKGPRVA